MAKKIIRSDERKPIMGLQVNGPVFFTSSIFIILSIALTLIYRKQTEGYFNEFQDFISNTVGWFFVLCVNVFLIFVIYLAFSKYGSIRIGGKDARPEFKTLSWFAMLFSAGMGIGLLFWSIAEPVTHFMNPPLTQGGTAMAAQEAMNLHFFIGAFTHGEFIRW